MTILEAIHRLESAKPNSYDETEKISWLSVLDGVVKNNIIDTHEGTDKVVFNGYNEETPLDTVLIVPAPYDEVYIRWMEAQIDYSNGEYEKYNNSMQMFNTALTAYNNYYNRTHMPLGKKINLY